MVLLPRRAERGLKQAPQSGGRSSDLKTQGRTLISGSCATPQSGCGVPSFAARGGRRPRILRFPFGPGLLPGRGPNAPSHPAVL